MFYWQGLRGWLRSSDPSAPNRVLYRAELHTVLLASPILVYGLDPSAEYAGRSLGFLSVECEHGVCTVQESNLFIRIKSPVLRQ